MNENKKEPSLTEKIKEGISVQEIESMARKYTTESFIILAIIIGTISSIFDFFTGTGWSITFLGIGAIIGIAFPVSIIKFEKKCFTFLGKQEKAAQIAIGIVEIAIALFVPFILFAKIGLLAGVAFHHFSHNLAARIEKESTSTKIDNDEEHI